MVPLWLDMVPLWLDMVPLWLDMVPLWLDMVPLWLDMVPLWLDMVPLWLDMVPLWLDMVPLWLDMAWCHSGGGGGLLHWITLFYTTLLPFFVYGVIQCTAKQATLNYTILHWITLFKLHWITLFMKCYFCTLLRKVGAGFQPYFCLYDHSANIMQRDWWA